jgi:rhodanese-related sulfurtransferase
VSPTEALSLVAGDDWVVVDVRPAGDYEKASADGAVNVPLFQALGGHSARRSPPPPPYLAGCLESIS